eukprot:scaffold305662_cov33-Tisochrysis_lutea.AAC.2
MSVTCVGMTPKPSARLHVLSHYVNSLAIAIAIAALNPMYVGCPRHPVRCCAKMECKHGVPPRPPPD